MTLDDGTELSRDDSETQLLLVTNNYVTTFDGFNSAMKLGELGGEDQIIMDYILHLTNGGADTLTIDKPTGRIVIANDKSPETYEVVIPVKSVDGEEYDFSGQEFEITVDNETPEKVVCEGECTNRPHYLLNSDMSPQATPCNSDNLISDLCFLDVAVSDTSSAKPTAYI